MNTNMNTHTSGSPRASNDPQDKTFVDPVLSAAAAGAAARQAKQDRIVQQQQLAKQQTLERQRQEAAPAPSQNEWTASLKRLAATAASTAATVAHVAAPMVQDASRLVQQSTKEAATTYRDEFRKVDFSSSETNNNFVNEEESVSLWPRSPSLRSRFFSSSESIETVSPSPISPGKIATTNLLMAPPLWTKRTTDAMTTEEKKATTMETTSQVQTDQAVILASAIEVPDISEKAATDPPMIPTELETPVLAQSTLVPKQDPFENASNSNDTSETMQLTSINEIERKDDSEESTKEDAAPSTDVPETTHQAPIEELEAKADSGETATEGAAQSMEPPESSQQTPTGESEPKPDSEESVLGDPVPKMENAMTRNGFDPSVPQSDLVRCFVCHTPRGKSFFSKSQLKKKASKCKQCVDKQNGAYQEPQDPEAGKMNIMRHSSTQEAMDQEPAKEVSEGGSARFDSSAQKQSENTGGDTRFQIVTDGAQHQETSLSQSESIEQSEPGAGLSPIAPQDDWERPAERTKDFVASPVQKLVVKGVTHKTNFALSTVDPDGIYETDGEYPVDSQSDASNTRSPTPTEDLYSGTNSSIQPQGPERFTAQRPERSRRPDSSQSQKPLFDNPKSFVEYVASRLTGYQVRMEERASQNDENRSWIKATTVKTYDPRESVFAQELFQVRSPSLSPLGSPPEARSFSGSDDEGENESLADSSVDPVSTLWDFIPNKRDVENELEIEEEDTAELIDPSSSNGGTDIDEGAKDNREARSLPDSNPSREKNRSLADLRTLHNDPALKWQKKRVKMHGISSPTSSKESWKPSTEVPVGQAPSSPTVGVEGAEEATFPEQKKHGPESLLVGWDLEAALTFPCVPDTEDTSIELGREELLDEALLTFSSLENIEFLDKIPRRKLSDENMRIAAVRWRQLLAHWKHSEIWKALNTRPCSTHFLKSAGQSKLPDDADSLSSSASVFRYNDSKATLASALSTDETLSAINKLSGSGAKVGGSEFLVMTGYLCDIGPSGSSQMLAKQTDGDESTLLRHKLATDNAGEMSFTLTDLLKHAEMNLTEFTKAVRHIVEFASGNNRTTTYGTTGMISYTVGIKKYTSIRRKAALKYNDDILQVKDVLRGQITFPDEAALVCGLFSLNDLCAKPQQPGPKEASPRGWPKIEIVRLKNLFRVSPLGNYFPSSLPTGYRHILINIRLGDTLIAGKFLTVSPAVISTTMLDSRIFRRNSISTLSDLRCIGR
jgi:hypothetical protein